MIGWQASRVCYGRASIALSSCCIRTVAAAGIIATAPSPGYRFSLRQRRAASTSLLPLSLCCPSVAPKASLMRRALLSAGQMHSASMPAASVPASRRTAHADHRHSELAKICDH